MRIDAIDHLVLTVENIDRSCAFYHDVLGMNVVGFGGVGAPRTALSFGTQKINLHQSDRIPDRNVLKPTPGSADFCLVTQSTIDEVVRHLGQCGVEIIEGPVARTGAIGAIVSVYIRDPDLNLVEIARYVDAPA